MDGDSKIEEVTRACRRCGEPFVPHKSARHLYCSRKCTDIAANARRRAELAAIRATHWVAPMRALGAGSKPISR